MENGVWSSTAEEVPWPKPSSARRSGLFPELEKKDDLKRRIETAAKYVPLENLCLSPQCGFSSTHHGNKITVDDQRRKLALALEVARDVWGKFVEKYGETDMPFVHRGSAALLAASAAGVLSLAAVVPVYGQEYPSKPVRIIVPLAPGGMADLLSRALAQRMPVATKQPVIVDNRTGGGGIIGAEIAAKSLPDGYTLFAGFHATNAILPHLIAKLPYDAAKDFSPIILMATVPNVLVVHPSVPVKSVKELVALARARRGELTYASQGVGSSGHIAGELFKLITKADIVHVPYKGAAPALQDLMGGHVMMMFDIMPFALPNMRSGRVRALAVATAERVQVAPDLPTMAEAGAPGIEGGAWFALFAPAGTPRPVIDWWNREARRALSESDARERFVSQGAMLPLGTPEALGAHVAAETQRWGRVIRSAGIKLE